MSDKEFNAEEETQRVAARAAAELPPGQDPDSVARLAKTVAGNNSVEGSAGLSTDPVTDEDREQYAEKAQDAVAKALSDVEAAAEKRRQSGTQQNEQPQGRTSQSDKQHTASSTKAADEPKSGSEPKASGGTQQQTKPTSSGGKS